MADDSTYLAELTSLQTDLLAFLRTFEAAQESIRPGVLRELQTQLVAATGSTFRRFESDFAPLTPPSGMEQQHEQFCAAVRELAKACELFMSEPGPQWTLIYLHSRAGFCRGLYALYELRDHLPILTAHFISDGATAPSPAPPDGTPRGFIHRERTQQRSDYTLYIPEDYSKNKPLPLILALHGGHGQGMEYVWTWLRPARSRGYAVLAPKSWSNTWDFDMPSLDTGSVLRMLDEVTKEYAIDPARMYLTGLSDGATYGYIVGLEHNHLFRGMAPIAGVLHPAVDQMLRAARGKDLPMLIVHGVHDFIFPVAFARSCVTLLEGIGYNLTYKELPDWGHAYPYSINKSIVMPWFESLPPKN